MRKIMKEFMWLNPKLIILFGSKQTKLKKGIHKKSDIDLIIVSDFFINISYFYRKQILKYYFEKFYDITPLTEKEYILMRKEKSSIVNLALKEGVILND